MTKEQRESNRAMMYALIKESETSGLSHKDYIASKGIRPWIFYYWKKQYRDFQDQDEKQSGFIPLSLTGKQTLEPGQIEFIFPNGVRAVVTGEISSTVVRLLTGM
jgi:hypothetical protein